MLPALELDQISKTVRLMSTIVEDKKNKSNAQDFEFLSDTSDRDKPWDKNKTYTAQVSNIYAQCDDEWLRKYGTRTNDCSSRLWLLMTADADGVLKWLLDKAWFCRVRTCPICQWRRSLMWKAKMHQALPKLVEEYPSGRWIFLTLTWRNCKIEDLRDSVTSATAAFSRLKKRKVFDDVLGWVRTVEVTRNDKDGTAHPHIHVLLFVKSTYFKSGHYISQATWADEWRQVNRFDYQPRVDVRMVKNRDGSDTTDPTGIKKAVAETLKYAVKPADMINDPKWFIELTKQLHRTRAIASGGVLKECFKVEKDNEELLLKDENQEEDNLNDDENTVIFDYLPAFKRYGRKRMP